MASHQDILEHLDRPVVDRTVQGTALALFDSARAAKALSPKGRALLALAVAYYEAIPAAQRERVDKAGRDLVLAAAIPGVSPDDQALVASVLAFQRLKLQPQREPAFLRLDKDGQEVALALAAILALAAALDPVAHAITVDANNGVTRVSIAGATADEVVAAAQPYVERWTKQIGPLALQSLPDVVEQQNQLPDPGADGLQPGAVSSLTIAPPAAMADTEMAVAEAARQQLRRFFEKLLARENGVRKGEDTEDIHQMRVATRRLRASLQVVASVFEPMTLRRYRRGLGRIARALGAVRDHDVFLAHIIAYRDGLPEGERARLQPLIDTATAERTRARRKLLDVLDARRYQKFKRAFATFLTTPGAEVLPPPEPGITQRVRDFAGSTIFRRYELWRAYEVGLSRGDDETLHQARIAGKHLRYTLEFFADALGPDVEQVLDPLVSLQDTLGALQDGVAAQAHIIALGLADDPDASQYLAARLSERDVVRGELPRRWEKVAGAPYRRRLLGLLLKL